MYQIHETLLEYSIAKYGTTIISFSDICDIEGLDRMTYSQMVNEYGAARTNAYIDEAIKLMKFEGKLR